MEYCHNHQSSDQADGHSQGHGHSQMVAEFRRRFWIATFITIPILLLSPMIQRFLGLSSALAFPGDGYILFILSSFVFFYGGWPFLKGLYNELEKKILA